ncbi:HutP family protein [Thermoanaerobacter wiegelii]|uniref:Hut operon positive regulatory protein n=1 Tax=Thermoanaerobacter wiegelii Rt8.B1 TaxID=697303 RepID=G2MWN9_9THEO|nr:HutP family protein [Thermoanaerobacter wiegelii]AEM79151.1 HutP family protein [Thermoanaerobacter wiegelii Rt8.B1]
MFINNLTVAKGAIVLSLSSNREEEEEIKKLLLEKGYKCAVTELGGKSSEFNEKIVSAVVGAALNNNVIEKNPTSMHALLHATIEAVKSLSLTLPLDVSLMMKIAVVADNSWIAVSMFGKSALHPLTNHERLGFGIMHL